MADAFAPVTNTDIGYERPTGTSQNNTAESLVRGLGGVLQGLSRTATQNQQQTVDPLRASLVEQFSNIEQQRAQGKTNQATMNERVVMRNYVSAGGEIDADLKAMVESTTGRPFDYVGQTEEQRQFDAMTESPEFQTAYVAAQATLGPNASPEDVTRAAMTSVTEQAIATDTIARIQSGEKVSWELQGQASYDNLITTFHQASIGGLSMLTEQDSFLTPDDVLAAKADWDMLKASALSRPSYVTDDQWKATQSRIAATDNLLDTMKTIASSEQASEQLKSVLSQSMGDPSSMSLNQIVTTMAAIDDPVTFALNSGINFTTELEVLSQRSEASIANNANSRRLIDTLDETSSPEQITGNVTLDQVPEEYSEAKNLSPEQHLKDLEAGNVLMSSIKLENMSNPASAAQFADGVATTGVVLLASDRFVSADMMQKLVGSGALGQKLDALEATDPDRATEARVLIRSGLEHQIGMLEGVESTLTGGLHMEYDAETKRYYITGEDAIRAAQTFYDGELTDKGFYIAPNSGQAMPQGYGELLKHRRALDIATSAFDSLGIEEPDRPVDTTNLQGQTLDVIDAASQAMNWNEDAQNQMLTDYLSAGGTNIDPAQTAWCAAFVNATLAKTGLNGTGLLNARSFLDWGTEVNEPVEGDVVVLSRGNNPAQGHVGFFKGFDSNGNIMILGGNQGDSVNITSYPPSRLLGYRRADGSPLPVEGTELERRAANQIAQGFIQSAPQTQTSVDQPVQPSGGAEIKDGVQVAALKVNGARAGELDEISTSAFASSSPSAPQAADSKPDTSVINRLVDGLLNPKQRRQIAAAGFAPEDVEFFEDRDAAEAALAAGEAEDGTLYVTKTGNVFLLGDDNQEGK